VITFNQLLFLALLVCTIGPIVWTIIVGLTRASLQIMLRRFYNEPTGGRLLALRAAASTRPAFAAKYALLQVAHDHAEFIMSRLRVGTPLHAHYEELHSELCLQLASEPPADVEHILEEHER
jgi:hypothetical protein